MTIFSKSLFSKLLILIAVIILPIAVYKIYIWSNTQTTDNAYIEANISSVSSEVTGTIEKIFVQENNLIKARDIIAKIEDSDYKTKLLTTEIMLESAIHDIEIIEQNIKLALINQSKDQEAYELAEKNFKIAQGDYKRVSNLSKDNYASQRSLDNSQITFNKANNELSQAELNVQSREENLTLLQIKRLSALTQRNRAEQDKILAKRALEDTNIRSPIDGVLGNSSLREGNYIRAGVILCSVVPLDRLYIKANFKETQISKFITGMKVHITIDSESNNEIMGVIRNIAPATGSKFSLLPPSNATGNFTKVVQRVPVTIDFTVPEHMKNKIIPGMSALIQVRMDQDLSNISLIEKTI